MDLSLQEGYTTTATETITLLGNEVSRLGQLVNQADEIRRTSWGQLFLIVSFCYTTLGIFSLIWKKLFQKNLSKYDRYHNLAGSDHFL